MHKIKLALLSLSVKSSIQMTEGMFEEYYLINYADTYLLCALQQY
jgi:hypothetical protein